MGYGTSWWPWQNTVKSDSETIKEEIKKTDILFITFGMEKRTTSGGPPETTKIVKELGILIVGIINIPSLSCKGNKVYNNAYNSWNITNFAIPWI